MTSRDGPHSHAPPRTSEGASAGWAAPILPLAIVASYVVYAPDVLAGIEPPKTFVAGLILGTAILQAIVTGAWRDAVVSLRATWSTGEPWRRAGVASLVAFLLVVGASTAVSIVPRSSVLGTLNRGQGTLFVGTLVVAIAACWPALRTPAGARSVVRAIAAGGFIPAVVAIVQSVGYDLARGGPVTTDRAAGTLGNPVNLGTMMAMSAVAAMALAYEAFGPHARWFFRPLAVRGGGQLRIGGEGDAATVGGVGGKPPVPRGAIPTASANPEQPSRDLAHERLPVPQGAMPTASANPDQPSRDLAHERLPVPQGAMPIILGALGVAVAIGTRVAGIIWPDVAWVVVPVSVIASALIASPRDIPHDGIGQAGRRLSQVRGFLWVMVAVACIAAVGASRSRGPAIALGVGAAAWITLAVLPHRFGRVRRAVTGVAVAGVVTVVAFVAGSALPATVRAIRALPAGAIGGGGAIAEVQAQAEAVSRDTLGTREIAWQASIDAFRFGSHVLDPRWIGTAMASSGHQIADLDAISALPDHRAASSLVRRAIGYGPESHVALLGTDAAGQPFDRAHAAPLDILLAHGAIGLAAAVVLATATVVVSVGFGRHRDATASDRVVVPVLVASGVASLTGVDGTAQVLVTWALVGLALARGIDRPRHDTSPPMADAIPGESDRTAVPRTHDGDRSSMRMVGAGALIAGFGIAVAMVVGNGATDPLTWAIGVASSVSSAYVIGSRRAVGRVEALGAMARVVIGPVVVASIVMIPAWAALAAGAEARASTSPGRSVDERQAGLTRAVTLDPGVVTYRQLRGM